LGTPAEYADAAAFLLTNGYINGEVMRLDGARRFTPKIGTGRYGTREGLRARAT
jgi:hypothetical protein